MSSGLCFFFSLFGGNTFLSCTPELGERGEILQKYIKKNKQAESQKEECPGKTLASLQTFDSTAGFAAVDKLENETPPKKINETECLCSS